MKLKRVLFALVAICLPFTIIAQEEEESNLIKISGMARIDYAREYDDHSLIKENSGFFGSHLILRIDGEFAENFSYSYSQQFNAVAFDNSFFDATEWLYLTYAPSDNWDISAGKLVVAIGGFEYDHDIIDCFSCSEFWNNISCYQFGVNGGFYLNNEKDSFILQVCQSPFHSSEDKDLYGYGVMWYGSHGCLETIYSANLFEYVKGSYISYISLGHQLNFGNFKAELDFINRADNRQTFFFDNVSVIGEVSYCLADKVNFFAKGTYDVNKSGRESDFTIFNGTELSMFGAGVEFFPIKGNEDLKIHANYFHTFGNNTNPDGTLYDKCRIFNAGLTWKIDLFKLAAK